MSRASTRYFYAYGLATAVFAAAGTLCSDSFRAHPGGALALQLLLFWLLNEAWYGICAGPVIALALLRVWKDGNKPKTARPADPRANWPQKLVRAASVVLVAGPHLFYAFAFFCDHITDGDWERLTGLAPRAPLFIASYLSCCALFALAWAWRLQPYSIQHVALYWLEAGDRPEHIGAARAAEPVPTRESHENAPTPPANDARGFSLAYDAHRARIDALLEPGEGILATTAPTPYAFNNQTRLECALSVPFLLGSLWAARMAVEVAAPSRAPWPCGVCPPWD